MLWQPGAALPEAWGREPCCAFPRCVKLPAASSVVPGLLLCPRSVGGTRGWRTGVLGACAEHAGRRPDRTDGPGPLELQRLRAALSPNLPCYELPLQEHIESPETFGGELVTLNPLLPAKLCTASVPGRMCGSLTASPGQTGCLPRARAHPHGPAPAQTGGLREGLSPSLSAFPSRAWGTVL